MPNNKLLVGGRFTNFNGIARRNLVKLNADGSLDTSFNYLSGPNYDVNSIALQPDGNFILTGQFLSYNGVGRNRIAKVLGGEAVSIPLIETGIISASTMCTGATILVPFSASGPLFFGNTFNAQLSDPSGSFANPLVIGSLTSTIGDTIQATIPYGVLAGTGYRIRVVASNLASTGFDNGMDLTINPTPVLSVLPLANTVCEGDSVSLAASGASIYTWLPGNFTGANITVYPDSTVTYSVTGYLNGCSASSSTAITVLPKPIAGFSYQISSCCEVILTNQTIGGATYEYDFGDGSLTSIQENPSYTYSIPGLYTITQTVTNAAGCIDTAALTIPIILSVDDYYHSGIKLYPNPAKDILRIDFPENNTDQIVTIEILNLLGSFLKKMEVSGNSTMLMVNDLPNGAYLIKIRSTGSTALKQLVVHH
ncbi:MAG: T9SS type A sorting domain-containing protein [Pedobacter sp.]|nr:MAG: T9SS type A sorting domain-containing protein [Pedobacter sp.]